MKKLGPCKTCQCYKKSSTALNQGHCLRFPPVPVLMASGGGIATVFGPPTVKMDCPGCFEHIPIEEPTETEAEKLAGKF